MTARILFSGDDIVELLPRRAYEACYQPDTDVIGFSFEAQAGSHAFWSDRLTPFRAQPNGLAYIPAGCDVLSRSAEGGEYLVLRSSSPLEGTRRFSDHMDRRAIAAAFALRRAVLGGTAADPLAIEAAVGALRHAAARALRLPRVTDAGRWMTPLRLKRVDEIIAAGLDQPVLVGEIARELGLSAGFFTRAFHAACGMPPHRYILERRLTQARQMLDNPRANLADIAAACGFASHAHLSASMRRYFGLTPSDLRRRL